ncbi:MAG TPA: ACP S-malonyltransferase [Clostridia bacterium]
MNKIAFLFPGQGSQYIGMGKNYYDKFPIAKQTFEEANEALGFDLKRLCFEGSMAELTRTENTQPAILTASVASFRVYMQRIGVMPQYMAGHSLGEISALCCSGAMEFADAVKIVRQRGKFMQEAVPEGYGGMAAISGIDKDIINEECRKISRDGHIVVISNYNSTEQTVISGYARAVADAGEVLKEIGARVVPLKVSAPFHSPLMQDAAERFEKELMKYEMKDIVCPVISNVTAEPYPGSGRIVEYLLRQITSPVRWQSTIEYIQKEGVDTAIEMGPQAILKNLMRKNTSLVTAYSFETEDDIRIIGKIISGNGTKDENTVESGMKIITQCIRDAVCTKNRNWDNESYRKGVVEPYKKLVEMKERLLKLGVQPDAEQVKESIELLKQIFNTKKIPADEQVERLNLMLNETGRAMLQI